MKKKAFLSLALALPCLAVLADVSMDVGRWQVSFTERDATLRLENRVRSLSVAGRLPQPRFRAAVIFKKGDVAKK